MNARPKTCIFFWNQYNTLKPKKETRFQSSPLKNKNTNKKHQNKKNKNRHKIPNRSFKKTKTENSSASKGSRPWVGGGKQRELRSF